MSFFNSKPWAKIPTDLLENKAMIQAEKELDEELRAAPVLLYLAGATKADEDGIFDIGDGREFAALIKSKTPEIVSQVISVMVKYRIFAHVPKSTIYLFAEWEYSTRQNGKALKTRFAIAGELWKKKLEEDTFFCPQLTKLDTFGKNIADTSAECLNTIQPRVNECFNTIQGGENGNPQIRREQIRETREKQIKAELEKTTHTRVEGVEGEISPAACESITDSPAAGSKNNADSQQNQNTQEKLMEIPDWTIVPESETSDETLEAGDIEKETGDASFVPGNGEKNRGEVVEVLNKFFVENNVSYNVTKGLKTVEAIAGELLLGVQTTEEARDLAKKICIEFKAMHDAPEGDRWRNIPLFPAYMAKEPVWAQLLSRVSRIYGTPKEPKKLDAVAQAKKDYEECMKEREELGNQIDAEYIRNGIAPDDPARAQKLFAIKMKGKKGGN